MAHLPAKFRDPFHSILFTPLNSSTNEEEETSLNTIGLVDEPQELDDEGKFSHNGLFNTDRHLKHHQEIRALIVHIL